MASKESDKGSACRGRQLFTDKPSNATWHLDNGLS